VVRGKQSGVKKRVLILLVMMSSAGHCHAKETPDWFDQTLKSEDPNHLLYFVKVDQSCPFPESQVQTIVEEVISRRQIEPINLLSATEVSHKVYLRVLIECMQVQTIYHLYSVAVGFGQCRPKPPIIYDYDFGKLGIGDNDRIIDAVERSVAEAMAEYVKANFKLLCRSKP
jgi:hypothetical protein